MTNDSEHVPLLRRVVYFFPIQLVLVLLKKNQTIVAFWILLFGLVTKLVAIKYGFPYLFLDPEYLDKVDFWSFLLVGFALGGFITAFNIASYIRNSFRFPFLATLSSPFLKFCANNSILPIAFILTYIYQIILFQKSNEFASTSSIVIDIVGFIIGIIGFTFISFLVFRKANKDLYKMYSLKNTIEFEQKNTSKTQYATQKVSLKQNLSWKKLDPAIDDRDWHVETYLTSRFQLRLARGFEHYDKQMLKEVFKQNHKTASVFNIIAFVSLLLLGVFREHPHLMIPAGASLFLLLTMLLMLTSALYTWFRGWTNFVLIGAFLLINFITKFEVFNYKNYAFGLNYNTKPALYSNATLFSFDRDTSKYNADVASTLLTLKKWKNKNTSGDAYFEQFEKPKFIMINCSGGGSRSAMWVVRAMQYADSLLEGKLMNQTFLITGSSGGLVGAAYFRELFLRSELGMINDLYNEKYSDYVGKDILNPIASSITNNDFVLRLQKHKVYNYKYTKDRGFAFENKLNINTGFILDKPLYAYQKPEENAVIPYLIASPTMINDGRRLLISPQNISYLTNRSFSRRIENEFITEAIEFRRLFEKQGADSLCYTSALRMSATFPYVSPIVSLPSEPRIELMDAGIRDNYGVMTSLQFLYTFRDWISENTSGVIIIQLRDRDKYFEVEENPLSTVIQTFSSPVGSFYNNLFHMQDYSNDQLIKYCNSWYPGQIDVINLELHNHVHDRISLSWHLTTKERMKVKNSVQSANNKESLRKLKDLIE